MLNIPTEALTLGGGIFFVAIALYLSIIAFRIPSPRELRDKDKQIEYFKSALEESERQKAALMENSQAWIKHFDALEALAKKANEDEGTWRQRVRGQR